MIYLIGLWGDVLPGLLLLLLVCAWPSASSRASASPAP